VIGFRLFETDHGFAAMAWSGRGVCGFRLPSDTPDVTRRAIERRWPEAVPAEPSPDIAATIDAAKRYFAGEQIDFSDVPVELGSVEPLFASIYDQVRGLRWGETTTYGAIARDLGLDPAAARAVGQAMARNPVPLIIPCHRVLAAGGRIGGFSAPGGSDAKARMLALEGVQAGGVDASQASFGF